MLILVLVGCSTPYQSKGFRGGYAETRVAENRYAVEIDVTRWTDSATAYTYLVRRAQEVCQGAGFAGYEMPTEPKCNEDGCVADVVCTNRVAAP